MVENRDEFMEVIDQDDDIELRKKLIEEAKQIPADADWNTVSPMIQNLKRKWKRINYWESALEDTLEEEFNAAIDVFYAKRKEVIANSQKVKEELIVRAEEVAKSSNFNEATNEMNELMSQWKAAGSAGNKETDDALWEKFSALRQSFFDRKHDFWQQRQEKSQNAKQAKEAIIQEAKGLAESTEWKKTGEKLNDLLNQWKAAGFAGKDADDALWAEFNAARQAFYDKRNAYYEAQREVNAQRAEAKAKLIEEAKALVEAGVFTKENTERVKQLNTEWKAIGFAGKDKEDALWKEFRGAADAYFDGLKAYNQSKHDQWLAKMQDAKNRKLELIQKQKRQLKWMEQEVSSLLSQSAVDDMKESIEDKKAFIAELEADLADLDKKING